MTKSGSASWNTHARTLFLYCSNSFGEGSGFGVYQLVGEALAQFPSEKVVPHLVEALRSQVRSVREWAAEIAMQFPEPELVEPLRHMLLDYHEDPEIRSWAATSIQFIDDPAVDGVLGDAQLSEQDPDVLKDIIEATKGRREALQATRRRSEKRQH